MIQRFVRGFFAVLAVAALLAAAPSRAQDLANSKAVDVAGDQGPRDAKRTELDAGGEPAADAPDSSADEERGGDENETFSSTLVAPDPKVKAGLEERLAGLEAVGLSDEERKAAADFYQQALDAFALAEQQYSAAVELQTKLDAIPTDLVQAEAPLLPFADTTAVPLAELETWAANNEKWLKTYREALAAREEWLDRRLQRLPELPKLIAQSQQQIKKLKAELAELGAAESAAAVTLAQMAALEQRCLALAATVQTLELEQRDYQERVELVQLERDRRTRKIKQKEDRLGQLRQEINQRREAEAQLQAEQAAEEAARQRPEAIAELARQNAALAEERTRVAASITETTKLLAAAADRRATLEREFRRAQQQDGVEELSDFIGHLLRQQQASLPNVRELKRSKADRDAIRAEVEFRRYELQDLRASLADVDARKREIIARAGIKDTTIVDLEVGELLVAQREYLDALMKNYDDYLLNLANLSGEEATLVATSEAYADFIAERVLWIRSCQVLQRGDLRPAAGALAWSLDPAHWRDAGKAVVAAAVWHPVQAVLVAIGFAALTALQRPARRRLLALGAEAAKRNCTRLRPTIQAVGLTAVVALPWPTLLAVVAWSLDGPWNDSEFARALSAAMWFAALSVLLLELIRSLCRGGGLADAHFDWPITCLVHLRRRLRWLVMLGLAPATWLVGLEAQSESSLYSSSLGRVLFIGVMLLLAAVHYRVLLARKSPFRQLVIGGARGWLAPVQIVWRPAAALLPAALAVLAAAGYYYTAQQAALRVLQTSALLLAVLSLGGFTRRWLLVSRRRLAREQAKQRRLQLAAAHEVDPQDALVAEVIDEAVDLAALSEQTQKLVRTFLATLTAVGFIVIWGALLPAVSYLGAAPLAPGAIALTWGQLLAFLAILAVTYASVRDIPAMLELVVLQHLPFDSGSRYALTSVCRYVLTAIGAVAAFKCVGGSWDKIQWLVAAMSVGLGFGLQEIFANFVSGIIILFERPIRVGDVVTLGDKTGVVNRIRMRATTIVDWDRKEYIVPNKDLVTERLLNWTLSDHTNRIVVNVSVANGSDTERACVLLTEAAAEQPHVLRDPAPVAAFESFGENGLNLSLRCFLPSLENRLATIHNLHTTIDRKFRTAGIDGAHGDLRIRVAREGRHADAAAATMAFAARQGAA